MIEMHSNDVSNIDLQSQKSIQLNVVCLVLEILARNLMLSELM